VRQCPFNIFHVLGVGDIDLLNMYDLDDKTVAVGSKDQDRAVKSTKMDRKGYLVPEYSVTEIQHN
jgi:hypothetical protein